MHTNNQELISFITLVAGKSYIIAINCVNPYLVLGNPVKPCYLILIISLRSLYILLTLIFLQSLFMAFNCITITLVRMYIHRSVLPM